jgi:hypothetical protein
MPFFLLKMVVSHKNTRSVTLSSAMDLGGSMFKRGWCGGDNILVVELCPWATTSVAMALAPVPERSSGVVQECVQATVC